MARKRPSERGATRAHTASEEKLKTAVVKHLKDDVKEAKHHMGEDLALAHRVQKEKHNGS
jgi:hypothetical protein